MEYSGDAVLVIYGREGLAGIIREKMQHDPYSYDEAFIFYSKDYRKVKILHYDINGFVLYQKWFDDGKFLKPRFLEAARCHKISRETLILLLSTSGKRPKTDLVI